MRWALLLSLLACSCATTSAALTADADPYLDGTDLEKRPLPPHPKEIPLPEGMTEAEWLVPVERGACISPRGSIQPESPAPCPNRSGLLVSETRAIRDGYYRIRYEELRKFYEADRSVWKAHRELYEKQLQLDEERLRELTPPPPSWWDRHGLSVIVGGSTAIGLVGGAALTVGVGYALYGTQPR